MKKIILFSLVIIMFHIETYSQLSSGKVMYEATLWKQKKFNLDTVNISNKAKSMLKNLMNNNNKLNYTLKFNRNESLFKKDKQLEVKKNIILKAYVGNGNFYYDKENDILIDEKDSYGELFLISYPITQWEITNETKKINGYVCGKAITTIIENSRMRQTSTIIAWFAYDLPLNYGPKQFLGLPGLVLELDYLGKYKLRATKIELNPKEEINIERPKKGIKMSLKKYEAMLAKSFLENIKN